MTFTLNKSLSTVLILSLFLFLGTFAATNAQSCSAQVPCPTGKECEFTIGASATDSGTCVPSSGGGGAQIPASGLGNGSPPTGGLGNGSPPSGGLGNGSPPDGGLGNGNPPQSGTLVNPLKVNDLQGLLGLVVQAAVSIGTIILVLALVWTGFLFVAARGNEEKIRTARAALFWTVIGGLILLGATGLSQVIQSTATSVTTP